MSSKRILITGGSSGLGLELAKLMIDSGNTVVICSRSPEKLFFAKRQRNKLITIPCDITESEDRNRLHEFITKQLGGLDMLINNAGIVTRFLIPKTDNLENIITREWQTNYLAPVMLSKLFLNMLAESKGTIVNINSGLAFVPLFPQANYCATKAALHSITQSMRMQLSKYDVKVIEVFYPSVDTPFQQGQAPKNAISPEVASKVAYQGIINGNEEIYVKMAGLLYRLSRLIPKRAIKMLNSVIPANYEEILEKANSQNAQ